MEQIYLIFIGIAFHLFQINEHLPTENLKKIGEFANFKALIDKNVKAIFKSKWFKIPFFSLLTLFALIGAFFTFSFLAIQLRLTDESGGIDSNNRYYSDIKDKYNQSFQSVEDTTKYNNLEALNRIILLNQFYPKNAQYILHAYKNSNNPLEILRMLDAADIHLKENKAYAKALESLLKELTKTPTNLSKKSIFEWMNIVEWETFKEAVVKDKKLIDSAARATGVESRLIVSCLVGEQIRLFNSGREAYKKWIAPLKILSVERNFSYGVTGIKLHTAEQIEGHLKNPNSEYYMGKKYEHLLDFKSTNASSEREARLASYKNHYYSYLYAAIFLKQVKVQWENAGFPIDHRPEILATLFNVGYPQSVPKADPKVGGSTIKIKEKPYSFGAIAYQFYYSGELFDVFPFEKKKFDCYE